MSYLTKEAYVFFLSFRHSVGYPESVAARAQTPGQDYAVLQGAQPPQASGRVLRCDSFGRNVFLYIKCHTGTQPKNILPRLSNYLVRYDNFFVTVLKQIIWLHFVFAFKPSIIFAHISTFLYFLSVFSVDKCNYLFSTLLAF